MQVASQLLGFIKCKGEHPSLIEAHADARSLLLTTLSPDPDITPYARATFASEKRLSGLREAADSLARFI